MGFYHTVARGETLQDIAGNYGVTADEVWDHAENARLHSPRGSRDVAPGDRVWIPVDRPAPLIELPVGLGRRLDDPSSSPARRLGVPVRSGDRYTFTAPAARDIDVQWMDHRGRPLSGWEYAIEAREGWVQGTLDEHGAMRVRIPAGVRFVRVHVSEPSVGTLSEFIERGIAATDVGTRLAPRSYPGDPPATPRPRAPTSFDAALEIGTLQRFAVPEGIAQRLANLAYFFGPTETAAIASDPTLQRRLARARAQFRRDHGLVVSTADLNDSELALLDEVASGDRSLFAGPSPKPNLSHVRSPDVHHLRVGERNVIRRPSPTQEIGVCGAGVYLRTPELPVDYPVDDIAANADWVCIALRNERGALNRGQGAYFRELAQRGVGITCFDWRPRRETWELGPRGRAGSPQTLDATVEFAAENGATAFVLNIEDGFYDRTTNSIDPSVLDYIHVSRGLCDALGLVLGVAFMGGNPGALYELVAESVVALPMTFAGRPREQAEGPRYFTRTLDRYFEAGARVFSLGVSMTKLIVGGTDSHGNTIWVPRNRTLAEFTAHLNDVPTSVDSVCAWTWGRPGAARGSSLQATRRLPYLQRMHEWWQGR